MAVFVGDEDVGGQGDGVVAEDGQQDVGEGQFSVGSGSVEERQDVVGDGAGGGRSRDALQVADHGVVAVERLGPWNRVHRGGLVGLVADPGDLGVVVGGLVGVQGRGVQVDGAVGCVEGVGLVVEHVGVDADAVVVAGGVDHVAQTGGLQGRRVCGRSPPSSLRGVGRRPGGCGHGGGGVVGWRPTVAVPVEPGGRAAQ